MQGVNITYDEAQRIKAAFESGESINAISRTFGRKRETILNLHKRGFEVVARVERPWTPDEIKTLKAMVAKRCKYREIGDVLGRTRVSVKGKVAALAAGREANTAEAWSDDEIRTLKNCLANDMTYEEAATCLPGRSASAVKNRCYILKIKPTQASRDRQMRKLWVLNGKRQKDAQERQFTVRIGERKTDDISLAADYLRRREGGRWFVSKVGDDAWFVGSMKKTTSEMMAFARSKGWQAPCAMLRAA